MKFFISISIAIISFIPKVLASYEPPLTTSVSIDDMVYRVGDIINATVTVTNSGDTDVRNITVNCINLPHQLVGADEKEQNIPVVSAGKSESIALSYRAIEGGRGRIFYSIKAEGFNSNESLAVSILGAGWYGGDNHSHSAYSDGSGTIQQNSTVAYNKGMSWNYTADHNNTRAREDSRKITAESRGDFIALTGVEIDNAIGHAVALQLPENIQTYIVRTVHEGYFDAVPDGADKPIEVHYSDTNLEGSDIFFGELFGGKTIAYIAVPGMGRTADYANIDVKDKIALVSRGEITYVEKINTAIAAGAAGVIIYNHSPGSLGMTLSPGAIGIGVSQADGQALAAAGKGVINFRTENLPSKEKKTWQMVVDEVNASGAFFVPAHPGDGTYPFVDVYEIRNFAGLEVWNNANPEWELNIRAFQQWDNINSRGDAKYFGMANSDAHSPNNIAVAYNMAYMNALTEENINKNMRNGAFFGSNGPQLRFDIDGVSMGKTLYITADKQNAHFSVRAFDDMHPLTEINLYRLKVTGEATDTKHLVQTWDLTGKDINHWAADIELEVCNGEFYRIEANSEKSTSSGGAAKGFAYSNPVWIEKTNAAATNMAYITNITLNNPNARLLQTKAGNYYVLCNNPSSLNIGQLVVSAAQGVKVEKTYDAANMVFNVEITSSDGTNKRAMKIFVK